MIYFVHCTLRVPYFKSPPLKPIPSERNQGKTWLRSREGTLDGSRCWPRVLGEIR